METTIPTLQDWENERDEKFMRAAIQAASASPETGDVPVGAIIVYKDEIIASACNIVEKENDSFAHAEILVMKEAMKALGARRLPECELFVTLEPCSMCAGAIVLARPTRLVIGATDPKTGACLSLYNITTDPRLNHRCEIKSGVLEQECSEQIKNFFKELRAKKK